MTISKLKLNRFKDKKAISSTIASVLLVGISVATFVLMYVWSQNTINMTTGTVKTQMQNQFDKTGSNISLELQGNKAIVFNEGIKDITKIAVYSNGTLIPCYSIEGNTQLTNLTWNDNFNDSTKTEIQTNTTISEGKATLDITFPPSFQSETPLSDYYDANSKITSIHIDDQNIYAAEYSATSGAVLNIYNKSNIGAGATPILNASVEPTDEIKDIHTDDNYIYIAGQDDEILVYNKTDKNLTTSIIATEPDTNEIDTIVSDGNFIYSATNAYAIITLTDKEWNLVREMNFWAGGVNSLYVDTKYVYAGLQDGSIVVVSKSNWQQTTSIDTGTAQITSVTSDVSRVYAATEDNFIYIYEKDTWDLLSTLNNS